MLFVAVIGTPVYAAPTANSIRVVLDDNYPPYIFRDATGQTQGILKDLWDLWQQRTGVQVDFQPMDWGKARATMESAQADVIDTIFETEERAAIETRWMGAKLPGNVWPVATRYGIYALLAVTLGVFALVIWNAALRRRVAARTAELELANKTTQVRKQAHRVAEKIRLVLAQQTGGNTVRFYQPALP